MSPADAHLLASMPWWGWPLALFAVCFLLGIVAVPAGLGGGVLFVPIVSGFFPFHLDYVRGAGMLVAMTGALTAAPRLLESGLSSLRLALPLALVSSTTAIGGALFGMTLPTATLEIALGLTVLAIVAVMATMPTGEGEVTGSPDVLTRVLRLSGVYRDARDPEGREWRARHTLPALLAFAAIGFVAGLFGLGAGWANVPAMNLLMQVPIKVAAGSSGTILTIAPASWVYLHQGAVLAMIAVPAMVGMTLGARIGVKLLDVMRPASVRRLAMALLFLAGLRALLKGAGLWT